jgi:lactoylglutathione lyase
MRKWPFLKSWASSTLKQTTFWAFFGEETTKPSVISWMPAASVYFRDPDGHMLEYLTMLDKEPRPDLGIIPWSEWFDQNKS